MFSRRITLAEQVEVSSGSMRLLSPTLEQHRPFQYELIAISGLAQTIEKTFQSETRKNQSKVRTFSVGYIQEFGAHGCRDIAGISGRQVRASMYGFITLTT